MGEWAGCLEGADVVVNLAGRTVNCRYNEQTFDEIMDSRIDSTRVLGQAILTAKTPPKSWLNMSTATIYAHRYEKGNDEISGQIGGNEPDIPRYWDFSVRVAQRWEEEFFQAPVPVRKVALRTAMVMSTVPGSAYMVMAGLAKRGLLGPQGDGRQFVSWIHESDFFNAVDFLIQHPKMDGVVNIAAPEPLPNNVFNATIRSALGVKLGLPAPGWAVKIGAYFMKTDPELVLKSRNVVPGRLMEEGFDFQFAHWPDAVRDLVRRLSQ